MANVEIETIPVDDRYEFMLAHYREWVYRVMNGMRVDAGLLMPNAETANHFSAGIDLSNWTRRLVN